MPTYPERYRIIDEMKNRYPITWLTEMAKVQRSGYYRWNYYLDWLWTYPCQVDSTKKHYAAIWCRYSIGARWLSRF